MPTIQAQFEDYIHKIHNPLFGHLYVKPLVKLATDVANHQAIRDANGIKLLVDLLYHNVESIQEVATWVLASLATNKDNHDAIRAAQGTHYLVQMLHRGTENDYRRKEYALWALRSLACNVTDQDAIRNANGINLLVRLLYHAKIAVKINAVDTLGHLATNRSNHVAIRDARGITPLVQLLTDPDYHIKNCASWAISSLATNENNDQAIIDANGISPLVRMLSDADFTLKKNAALALSHLCYRETNHDKIRAASGIAPLVRMLSDADFTLIRAASGIAPLVQFLSQPELVLIQCVADAMRNLAVNENNHSAMREAHAIQPLANLLSYGDTLVNQYAAAAFKSLAVNENNHSAIREAHAIQPLVKLLSHSDIHVNEYAAGALKYLALDKTNHNAIVEAEGFVPLVNLLSSESVTVKLYAAGVLKELSDDVTNHEAILDAGGVIQLVPFLSHADIELKNYASYIIKKLDINDNAKEAAENIYQLVQSVKNNDTVIKQSTKNVLEHLHQNTLNPDKQDAIVNAGGIETLINLYDNELIKRDVEELIFKNIEQLTDAVENSEALSLADNQMSVKKLTEVLSKNYMDKILCYSLEHNKKNVSEFILKAKDISYWLGLALKNNNEALISQLIHIQVLSRIANPYDMNFQHIPTTDLKQATDTLQNYEQGKSLSDDELLQVCDKLQALQSNSEEKIQKLSEGLQTKLIARHNQHISESSDTLAEQEWFESKPVLTVAHTFLTEAHSSVFEKALSTFKVMGLFKTPEIELIRKILRFNQVANKEWSKDNVQDLLGNVCDLLNKSGMEASLILEQAYLRPLLYLLDDKQKTITEHSKLPIAREKLVAIKQLYQAVTSVTVKPARTAEVYVIATGKILHSLLVLTEQKQVLVDWFSGVLTGKNDAGETVTKLLQYVAETQNGMQAWMDKLTELDQLMNLATFQALQSSLDTAQKTVCLAIEKIIFHTSADKLSKKDREELMIDIATYMDLSQAKVQSGLIRYYPLLIIAAQYYDKKNLSAESNHLLSIAFSLRFMHQLSSVRNLPQLLILAEEISVPVISGTLGTVPQVLAIFGRVYSVLSKAKTAENQVDFCCNLIQEIESALPENSEWRDTLMAWLSTARDSFNLMKVSSNDRLDALKQKEDALIQQPVFSNERKTALRLLVSAHYLYELPGLLETTQINNFQELLPKILTDFVKPVAILWEQHDLTASAILVPKLLESFIQISSKKSLTIDKYIDPILIAMRETHDIFENLGQRKLLDNKASLVCTMVKTGKDYLEVGNELNQVYQLGKVIFKMIKSLKFFAKGLKGLSKKIPGVSESVAYSESLITTLLKGDLEGIQEGVKQIPDVISTLCKSGNVVGDMALGMVSVVSAVGAIANVCVTIHCHRETINKLESMAAQSLQQHQELNNKIDTLTQQIDHKFTVLKDFMDLSFHAILSQQDKILNEVEKGFKQAEENASIRTLIGMASGFFEKQDIIDQSISNKLFEVRSIDALIDLYRIMVYPAGLMGPSLNGTSIDNRGRARSLLFLQLFFNQGQSLPNLSYWVEGSKAIIRFLRHFDQFPEDLQIKVRCYTRDHIEVISKTHEILQALNTETTKCQIVALLSRVKEDPYNESLQEHMHSVARLCGLPLHQFGEDGFELWSQANDQALNSDQQRHKKLLETMIIETLITIMESKDSPNSCSTFTLSLQSILTELVKVGRSVYPELTTNLSPERAIVVHNSSSFFNSSPQDDRLAIFSRSYP